MGSNPGWGRSPGEEGGNPLQCSCLGNSMDREAGGLESTGSQRVDMTKWLSMHTIFVWISKMKSSLFLPIYLETVNHSFSLWIDEHSFTSDVKHRQTPWATVQITGTFYVYANFIPDDQKTRMKGQLGCPAWESWCWKISPQKFWLRSPE